MFYRIDVLNNSRKPQKKKKKKKKNLQPNRFLLRRLHDACFPGNFLKIFRKDVF